MQVTECPQCGAPAEPSISRCTYCKAEFFITSLAYLSSFDAAGVSKYISHYKGITREDPDNPEGILGLGLCYLHMGTYPLAQRCFEKVIEVAPEIPQTYYYFALSTIRGRRLMTLPLKEVRLIETYLLTAIQMDSDAVASRLLLALLKQDYYEMNGMRVKSPSAVQLLAEIDGRSVPAGELERLRGSIRVADDSLLRLVVAT